MKHTLVLVLATALSLLAAAAPAQPEEEEAPEDVTVKEIVKETVVVSANRFKTPASEVGSSVTVIELEEIERRGQVNAKDLLRTVPGVEVVQTGGPGKATTVRIRGGSASQALINVDGVRINSVTGGDVDFSNLTTDNIESIEILRGPQATYGSEAMSGVISIRTRQGEEGFRVKALVEGGSHNHQRYELGLSGATDIFDYSLSASDLSTDAVSQRSGPGYVEEDPFDNRTYTARLGVRFLEDGRVDLSYRNYEGDTSLDGFGIEDLNATQTTDGESFMLTVEKNLASFWRQTFRYGESSTDLLGVDPDSFFNIYDIRSQNSQFEAQADVTLSSSNTLNLGYTTEERNGLNVGDFGFDETADLDSWFIQDQWSPTANIHLTAAVRNDDHSVFGDETTYRATGTGSFNSGQTRIHGSVGSAFRAPNFNELYFPFAGDPTLLPETSEGFDLGLHHHTSSNHLSFDVTYFDIDFDNLIGFDLVTFLFQNIAQASSSGAELTVGVRRGSSFDLTFSHTYNDTEDSSTGDQLARRPKNRTTLVAQFIPTKRLDGAVMIASVRDRIDSAGQDMDDYTKLDLSVRYQLLSWLRPFARIDNALDENYEEVPGFTTPGRTYVVGLTLSRE